MTAEPKVCTCKTDAEIGLCETPCSRDVRPAPLSSNPKLYRIADPENDLFSDAMDRAASTFHSVRHGAQRNADHASEPMDGEKLVRRALAAAFNSFLEEIGPAAETTRYAGDSFRKLIADMTTAAHAARTNQRDGVAAFVAQWIERLRALTSETTAPHDELRRLRGLLADALCAEDHTDQRLRDCELSLRVFDPGETSEYWLKHGSPERTSAHLESCHKAAMDRLWEIHKLATRSWVLPEDINKIAELSQGYAPDAEPTSSQPQQCEKNTWCTLPYGHPEDCDDGLPF